MQQVFLVHWKSPLSETIMLKRKEVGGGFKCFVLGGGPSWQVLASIVYASNGHLKKHMPRHLYQLLYTCEIIPRNYSQKIACSIPSSGGFFKKNFKIKIFLKHF
jgi:hypothetical protein